MHMNFKDYRPPASCGVLPRAGKLPDHVHAYLDFVPHARRDIQHLMSPSTALGLISEDELKKVIAGDRLFKHRDKLHGLIPRGMDSPFGNFTASSRSSSLQTDTITIRPRTVSCIRGCPPPPSTGIFSPAPIIPTQFRRFYIRGDLPIHIEHGTPNSVGWQIDPRKLDYETMMPLFFDGLREKEDPYRFLAVQGSFDLIRNGTTDMILPVIQNLIIPTKAALDTRDPEVIITVCLVLQALLNVDGGSEEIGNALVPYYRQLLPTLNVFKAANENIGDQIYYNQRKRICLGDVVYETLSTLERFGGQDAYINIKYMIPTYESIHKF